MRIAPPLMKIACYLTLAWGLLGIPAGVMAQTQPASQAATAPAPSTQPAYTVAPATQPAKADIGSTDPASGYKLQARFTYWGAGLWEASLTDYQEKVLQPAHYKILYSLGVANDQTVIYPLAARSVTLDGQTIDLQVEQWSLASANAGAAIYTITILDHQKKPVLEIQRTFHLDKGSYDIQCRQKLVNLSPKPLHVIWEQNAQGDIAADEAGYMGDRREFMAGYHNLIYNPTRQFIYNDGTELPRAKVIEAFANEHHSYWPVKDLPQQYDLVWLASLNRYFAAAVHPLAPTAAHSAPIGPDAITPLDKTFSQVSMQVLGEFVKGQPDNRVLMFTLRSPEITLPPRGETAIALALFAGPRSPKLFAVEPYKSLGLGNTVVYNLGGVCGFCTRQWVAQWLFYFLKAIHFVIRDWGLAIIVLVVLVRGVLHPITRKSQINMAKMQKQMGTLQPEIEKLKKKYKDDSARLQQETMKLYREKGVNPMNMLGCLPQFLQMPIWFALYAMLYFAIELRHTPAFFGLFQWVSGGKWVFLADLSSADQFIRLGSWAFTIPLLGWSVDSINLLPILMAGVFYLQQAYATPPATNEQAAQQQKMMKWMSLLFPLMMYKMPAGLNLYIMASTAAGIIDSYVVKQHIKKEEAAGTLFTPKPANPNSLWTRLQKMVEERQRALTGEPKRRK